MIHTFCKGNIYYLKKEHIKEIFDAYKVTSIEELRKAIENGHKAQVEDQKARRLRLGNEKIELEKRFLELRIKYFESFGVDISHSGKVAVQNMVNEAKKDTVESISDVIWKKLIIFSARITSNMHEACFFCKICNDGFEKIETCKIHVFDNHKDMIQTAQVELLK